MKLFFKMKPLEKTGVIVGCALTRGCVSGLQGQQSLLPLLRGESRSGVGGNAPRGWPALQMLVLECSSLAGGRFECRASCQVAVYKRFKSDVCKNCVGFY